MFGHLNSNYQVVGGFPIPGLASILSDPKTGTSTVVQGLNTIPTDDEPTTTDVNVTHLAWDIMIGLGTLLMLLSLCGGRRGSSDETCHRADGSSEPLPPPASSGGHPRGRVTVSEVGRHPGSSTRR